MNDIERDACDKALTEVMSMYSYAMTSFEARIWATIIDKVSASSFQAFLQQHILTSKFAPKPADASGMLGLGGADAQVAYAQLEKLVRQYGPYKAPTIGDPVLLAAIHQMGGWAKVNTGMPDMDGSGVSSFDVKAFKDRFEAAYRMASNEVCIQGIQPAPISVSQSVNAARLVDSRALEKEEPTPPASRFRISQR